MQGPRMHVTLPPPQPSSCPQQRKEHAPRRSSPLWSLLLVPGVRCVLLCAHRSVCTRAGAAVQKCGVRKKCMYINVCKCFACVQLTMSTCTCVCVDNGVPALVTFFVTVLSINDHSTCGATRCPWIPRKACTANKSVLCCIPSLGKKESNVVICSFPSVVSTVCGIQNCYHCGY